MPKPDVRIEELIDRFSADDACPARLLCNDHPADTVQRDNTGLVLDPVWTSDRARDYHDRRKSILVVESENDSALKS